MVGCTIRFGTAWMLYFEALIAIVGIALGLIAPRWINPRFDAASHQNPAWVRTNGNVMETTPC
jgi:hypothetical protein